MPNRLECICGHSRGGFILILALAAGFLCGGRTNAARRTNNGEPQRGTTLFVDASSGADSNAGTASRPLLTIGRAAQIALGSYRAGRSTTIVINPGTYRESIELEGAGQGSNASITFEAAKPGSVVITGSDIWTGWQPDASNASRYTHDWPVRMEECDIPANFPNMPDIVRRQEMVFVNGAMLNQVLSLDQMAEGTFFVDDGNARVYAWGPAGTNISGSQVEVAVRPHLFVAERMSNVVLRGLVFEHASTCLSMKPHTAVAFIDGSNDLVEDCRFEWNNWYGFGFNGASNSTARHVVATHNGASGLGGGHLRDVTYDDVETSYNNWRGAMGQFYGWDIAGAKFLAIHGGTFNNFRAFGNQTRGLWFDSDNQNITVNGAFLAQNLNAGLFLEANPGPIVVKDSKICDNGEEGITTNNSEKVTLAGNVIYNNKKGQVFVNGRAKSRTAKNWETNSEYVTVAHEWNITGNTIVAGEAGQLLFENFENNAESSRLFFSSLTSDRNTWFSPENERAFQFDPGGPHHRARELDFKGWQSMTGQDANSTFAAPPENLANACQSSR